MASVTPLSERTRDILYIASASVVPLVLLRPLQDAPFVDDWVYAWSVEHLLNTGNLQILDNSTSINVFQILWGALFCLPFGFSFAALKLSTWTASVSCLIALYLTLRELGVVRRARLIAVAALGLYPVYFILSFTFMSDVPFVSVSAWFSFALLRALRRKSLSWLIGAALFACLAIGVRVIGVACAGALLLALAFHARNWKWSLSKASIAALPLVFTGLLTFWYEQNIEERAAWTSVEERKSRLKQGIEFAHWFAPEAGLMVVSTAGFTILPLVIGATSLPWKRVILAAIVLMALWGWQRWYLDKGFVHPLKPPATWTVHELGATEALVPGFRRHARLPRYWYSFLFASALASVALALAAISKKGLTPEDWSFVWLIVGHVGLITILWLFYDRYSLVILPGLLTLVVKSIETKRIWQALGSLAIIGSCSLLGARDHVAYNGALWDAVAYIDSEQIDWSDVDGGYVVNGWKQYAHPEDARLDRKGRVRVPWVNVKRSRARHMISNSVSPGDEILQEFPYSRWIGRSGSVYVIKVQRKGTKRNREEPQPK